MLQAPADNILVEIKSRYDEEIKFASGVTLYVDPRFNPNFHATIEGVVHSVPVRLKYQNENIKPIVRPGDTILFSYKTVGDTTFAGGTELFRMTTKGEGYFTEWMNQDRETIKLEKGPRCWAVVFIDKTGNLVAGKTGSQGECENWIAQNFKFASSEGFTYDNQVIWEGLELWKIDYSYVFAIKRDGHTIMLDDYLLVEPICERRSQLISPSLYRPEGDMLNIREDKGWLRAGERAGLKNGDVLIFDPNMKEKYNVGGVPMYIVRRRYVLGKELAILPFDAAISN